VKYTFDYDLSLGSYLEAGGKYSPETNLLHKNSAMFLKGDVKAWKRLYLGGQVNHMPTRIDRYEGLVHYFYNKWNEIYLNVVYSDDRELKEHSTYTGLGVRSLF
jgi:hypothetical protein